MKNLLAEQIESQESQIEVLTGLQATEKERQARALERKDMVEWKLAGTGYAIFTAKLQTLRELTAQLKVIIESEEA